MEGKKKLTSQPLLPPLVILLLSVPQRSSLRARCTGNEWEMERRGRAHLPAARQARQGHPSLTHTLSLSLARDNHGDGDAQPDTVVERFPPSASHLVLVLVSSPQFPLPLSSRSQPANSFLTLSYIIPHSPNPATSCLAPSGI